MDGEPVGNQPRRTPGTDGGIKAITGNSHKDRDAVADKTAAEREPVEKGIEGKVVVRKTAWYKKFGRGLLADDIGNIGDHILSEVIIPATKKLIVEAIGQSVERMVFGSTGNRLSRRTPIGLSLREQVNYRGVSSDRGEPRRIMSREARARHDFNEIVLEHRSEAIEAVEFLVNRIVLFGAATVADLYDFVGVTGSYLDRQWGWTDLVTADVRQVPLGFLLDLPAPEPIR